MQDVDAARRLAILRGETPPPLPEAEEQPADPTDKKHVRGDRDGTSRKRKRAGEDDTEFEMRVARERAEEGARVSRELAGADGSKKQRQKEREDVDIVDSRGFIDLVGPPPKDAGSYEAHPADRPGRERRETADRGEKGAFGDLAAQPWYKDEKRRQTLALSDACKAAVAVPRQDREAERGMEAPTKDVWGRDDPKRRGRETARLDANDPLAAMRSGAKKVRDIGKERRREAEERSRELEQLRQDERRREKRRKREQARADGRQDDHENGDGPAAKSHRSGRSDRRRHGDERRDERHEDRRDHVRREERPRHKEAERARDREDDRRHGRDRERSRDRRSSSRSHRHKDRDDRREHRGKDHERRSSESKSRG